ncbi:multidrug transporter [Butyrivibrio sp.]|uniref:multidrug transporter n=1 Tax=Butyrivibrio sp. TaxID=28121 RepID=UPI0025BF6C7F|nr:multidrug transporter [Butyrivibrio sp.]MBQ9301833.1 multidrug transporter [Butyrivibrio sp.]
MYRQNQGFKESDWKLFRKKIADWQENYMDKLNHEYIELLSGDGNPSDKFWKLDERLKEDKKFKGVQVHMSRSEMIFNILDLLREGAITQDDLSDFSDELKDTIRAFTDRHFLSDDE